jgi:hypothetical protein
VPKLPNYCRNWKIVTGGRSAISYSNKGFLGKEGHMKRPNGRDDGAPIAKRWAVNNEARDSSEKTIEVTDDNSIIYISGLKRGTLYYISSETICNRLIVGKVVTCPREKSMISWSSRACLDIHSDTSERTPR